MDEDVCPYQSEIICRKPCPNNPDERNPITDFPCECMCNCDDDRRLECAQDI